MQKEPIICGKSSELPQAGDHTATILNFGDGILSNKSSDIFLPVHLYIDAVGNDFFSYIKLSINGYDMIKRAEPLYKGKTVTVSLIHMIYNAEIRIEVRVKWSSLCPSF